MKLERRRELKERARYFAAGMVENIEILRSGQFDDIDPESPEGRLLEDEMAKIGKRIYKGDN